MLSLFLCLSSAYRAPSGRTKPKTYVTLDGSSKKILVPTSFRSDYSPKTFTSADDPNLLTTLKQIVGEESAKNLANKIKYAKSTAIDHITFGIESSDSIYDKRLVRQVCDLVSLKRSSDNKVTLKTSSVTAKTTVYAGNPTSSRRQIWVPCTAAEITSLYNALHEASKSDVDAAIKSVKA